MPSLGQKGSSRREVDRATLVELASIWVWKRWNAYIYPPRLDLSSDQAVSFSFLVQVTHGRSSTVGWTHLKQLQHVS